MPTTTSSACSTRTGRLIERYEYTPYGQRTVYTHTYFAADLDGDNDVDNVDIGIQSGNFTGSVGAAGGKTRQQGDMDGDGDVDNMDIGILTGQYTGSLSHSYADDPLVTRPALMSFRGGIPGNPTGLCEFGHQGLMHDEGVDLIHNRARTRNYRGFLQRDPPRLRRWDESLRVCAEFAGALWRLNGEGYHAVA
jgi:hypothetical protein